MEPCCLPLQQLKSYNASFLSDQKLSVASLGPIRALGGLLEILLICSRGILVTNLAKKERQSEGKRNGRVGLGLKVV